MRYVSIHTHTTYSYGDGYGLPEQHVGRVKELGMTALAVTDHGNVSAHVKLEIACKKSDIKPIFGIEAYCAPANMRETGNMRKWHQTMLAMDESGYQNLMRIVSHSWDADFYRWPTVLGENLRSNSAGLILTSGCSDSHLACTLLGGKGRELGDYEEAVKVLKGYKRMFGDRYYLEVQRFPQLERTRMINQQYALWSREFGIPLVASSDVHYYRPEQNEIQKILHASSRNTGTVAAAEAGWEYGILLTYPESDKEIRDDLVATGLSRKEAEGAILSTQEIAERCNVILPKMERIRYPGTVRDLAPWAPPKALSTIAERAARSAAFSQPEAPVARSVKQRRRVVRGA